MDTKSLAQKHYNTAKDDHAQYLVTTQFEIAFLVDKHMYKTKPTTTFTYIAEIETRYRNYYFESPDHEWKQQLLYRKHWKLHNLGNPP